MIIPLSLKLANFLIDTCFFIDAYSKPHDFETLISEIKDLAIAKISIYPVKFEFIRSRTTDVIKQKSKYFEALVDTTITTRGDVEDLIPGLMEEYKHAIEGISITDLYLGACLKKYQGLYLLTRNHKDFPRIIFTRAHIFPMESDYDIKTYALYQYKPKKKIVEEIPF